MPEFSAILTWACRAGVLLAVLAYVYGCIAKPKGDRRVHTAALFFTTLALANLPPVLVQGARDGAQTNAAIVVGCLLVGLMLQAYSALRGRRSDRRAPRLAEPAPGPEPAATT